jgi:hypothetical protein
MTMIVKTFKTYVSLRNLGWALLVVVQLRLSLVLTLLFWWSDFLYWKTSHEGKIKIKNEVILGGF